MSLPISALTAIAKTSIGATHYLPLADGTAANYKLLIQDLFPAMNTLGTSSESLFVSVTNKNTLNFKGIKSLSNILSVGTNANNIQLNIIPAQIDLSLCDNSASAFLTGPISLSAGVGGTLPVANGGTGLTTLTSNSLFVGNGTSALTALGVATNGQIPIGRTGLSPVLATLTAGTNVSVTNGAGSITIAASLTTLTANLNGAGYNIYGLGWLSGDAQNEGIAINSTGKVFVGSSTPTAFYDLDLNVNNGIALNGSNIQNLAMTLSATPATFLIGGASASVANVSAGLLYLYGGTASGTGNGGGIDVIAGSASGSGSGGTVNITGGQSGSATAGPVIVQGGMSSTGTGGYLLLAAGASGTSSNGGSTIVQGGTSVSGNGGSLQIFGGASGGSGTGGNVTVSSGTSVSSTAGNVTVRASNAITVSGVISPTGGGTLNLFSGTSGGTFSGGPINIVAGGNTAGTGDGGNIILTAGPSPSQNGGDLTLNGGSSTTGTGGDINITPGVATSGIGGLVVQTASAAAKPFTNFIGTQTGASANSLSSSTTSTGAKTGAIKVQINGIDAWIRVYATAE
jgi:hypothetical protein